MNSVIGMSSYMDPPIRLQNDARSVAKSKKGRPNKALQLTPSRYVPLSYDRPPFPFTSLQSLCALFGVAELDVRLYKMLLLSRVIFWGGLIWLICSAFLTYPLVHAAILGATSDYIGRTLELEDIELITERILGSIPNFLFPTILIILGGISALATTRRNAKAAEQGAAANP